MPCILIKTLISIISIIPFFVLVSTNGNTHHEVYSNALQFEHASPMTKPRNFDCMFYATICYQMPLTGENT